MSSMTETNDCTNNYNLEEDEIDPILDIIDYLVRSAKISFKNSHLNEVDVKTSDKIKAAHKLYNDSPTNFLLEYGKYLSPNHLEYFENIHVSSDRYKDCVSQLKQYHSHECTHKRIRNRRFKALNKLKADTDYFSDKQMMYRNPLLYDQLVGQYLTDEEIQARDGIDNDRSFLNIILETVDRKELEEVKNKQSILEEEESSEENLRTNTSNINKVHKEKRWGEFDEPEAEETFIPKRREALINANERNLLREEFLQEMYSSFIEGRDVDFDYSTVDSNEEYDDLDQISRDAEDKYFDSEQNEVENLEEHMKLVQEYGRKKSDDSESDPLDIFMQHISNKLSQCYV